MIRRFFSQKKPGKLSLRDINQNLVHAEYAVRGAIPTMASQIEEDIKYGRKKYPFDHIVQANIGNPQQLNQKPLTWYRQVLSILQYPKLLEVPNVFPSDTLERAKNLMADMKSIGAYSMSQGSHIVRESIASYIAKRDGCQSDPRNIILTNGASSAVGNLFQLLSGDLKSGFLIPIPQYPLYTATITLNSGKAIGYYLQEEDEWAIKTEEIRNHIESNIKEGISIKALVVINPGNPTGSVLSRENIVKLIEIAARYGIVLVADEVYQVNIFKGEFISFKKVLSELQDEFPGIYDHVQLASLHSTSKGVSGECGQRGGYMELVGFEEEVKEALLKISSIDLCSVVGGQALVELMVNPPKPMDPSYDLFLKETTEIHNTLSSRSQTLFNAFENMEDISCNQPHASMYLFPRLNFKESEYPELYEKAAQSNSSIDTIYCMELLQNTGICCVPGSGFGQVPGTSHLRTTFLAPGKEWIFRWDKYHKEFVNRYKKH